MKHSLLDFKNVEHKCWLVIRFEEIESIHEFLNTILVDDPQIHL